MATDERQSVEYCWIHPASDILFIPEYSPYRAVIICEVDVESEWRLRVSGHLVDTGCLYAMAWGTNCSLWDDAVDLENLERFDYGDIPDDRSVMTTWHANESRVEVFGFAKLCAWHSCVDLFHTVIVDISRRERRDELLSEYYSA